MTILVRIEHLELILQNITHKLVSLRIGVSSEGFVECVIGVVQVLCLEVTIIV